MYLSKARKEHYKEIYNNPNNCNTIHEFYKKPSQAKINAEYEILTRMRKNGGYGYKVTGGNCHSFTAMWKTHKKLFVETYNNTFAIDI